MALYDRVKVTTSTTGTGTITLGAAASGARSFSTAGVPNGAVVSYAIEDGSNWEVGTGTYNSGTSTLTRTVTASSNSNSAINLSGSASVYITALAADFLTAANTASTRTGSATTEAITPAGSLNAMAWATLTYGATTTPNHANGINQKLTLTGNPAIAAPTNPKVGWPLNIWIVQDATGSRVPSWNAVYDFGDYGTPNLSAGANREDIVSFLCLTTTKYAFMGIRKRVE